MADANYWPIIGASLLNISEHTYNTAITAASSKTINATERMTVET